MTWARAFREVFGLYTVLDLRLEDGCWAATVRIGPEVVEARSEYGLVWTAEGRRLDVFMEGHLGRYRQRVTTIHDVARGPAGWTATVRVAEREYSTRSAFGSVWGHSDDGLRCPGDLEGRLLVAKGRRP